MLQKFFLVLYNLGTLMISYRDISELFQKLHLLIYAIPFTI